MVSWTSPPPPAPTLAPGSPPYGKAFPDCPEEVLGVETETTSLEK